MFIKMCALTQMHVIDRKNIKCHQRCYFQLGRANNSLKKIVLIKHCWSNLSSYKHYLTSMYITGTLYSLRFKNMAFYLTSRLQ
jgi:hypothetical protein